MDRGARANVFTCVCHRVARTSEACLWCPVHRRGSGMVRTLVVASATLAILLVCFSIYQSRQLPPPPTVTEPRLPPTPTQAPSAQATTHAGGAMSGIPLGRGGEVSHGRDVKISIYPREGTRARLEIAVESWRPTGQVPNEFLLINPEVRLRTSDGRAVRVTAQEGVMEGERRGSGSLDPRRGELTGDVVIEVDRLTENERAKLPAAQRDVIDPSQIVRIDVSRIQFDLEYSKVVVPPGAFKLSARDVEFVASELEVRFDEAAGTLDTLRSAGPARIVLKASAREFGVAVPGTEEQDVQQVTVVEWLRATLEQRLTKGDAKAAAAAVPPVEPAAAGDKPAMTVGPDGVPIFRPDSGPRPPREQRFVAQFAQDVQVRQMDGATMRSHLQADALEIVRAFTDADRRRAREPDSAAPTAEGKVPAGKQPPGTLPDGGAGEHIVVEWTGHLFVESCKDNDPRCASNVRSRVVATGSAVRLTGPQGNAVCRSMTFDPDRSVVWLEGTEASPVQVQSAQQGTLTGLRVQSEQTAEALHIVVTGPGTLQRTPEGLYAAQTTPDSATTAADASASGIRFADRMELFGRIEARTRLDLSGMIARYKARVMDRAVFTGGVQLLESDTQVNADSLTAYFGSLRGHDRQDIDRVEARGHVVLSDQKDRLSCDEMDLELSVDGRGRTIPLSAEARGHVEAQQRRRLVSAKDKLIADFEMVERPPPPFDMDKARQMAVAAGVDPRSVDWEAKQKEHESKRRTETGVKRLRAWGKVKITDPAQNVDISAESLDCSLVDGREIAAATLEGSEAEPASALLSTFAVTGKQVRINVRDEWAEVPGAGRLTMYSKKDLDGRRLAKPMPIVITWSDWMKYQGRENRSVFAGHVHAASGTNTTFDSSQLAVEFDEVAPAEAQVEPSRDWWIFTGLMKELAGEPSGDGDFIMRRKFNKEPAYILATGQAVAEMSELESGGEKLRSRARIAGPRLSVNLRKEVSKMLIEGAGYLQIEDFSPADPAARSDRAPQNELFTLASGDGPSKTLIEWQQSMWYDFSIRQTRFEGQVNLKHFSGRELERIFGPAAGAVAAAAGNPGRSTFLKCDALTTDFSGRDNSTTVSTDDRLGRLSANDLKSFRAAGNVTLQDKTEGLSLTSADLIYERDRSILFVQGSSSLKARIVLQRPGEYPTPVEVERFIYNLKTKSVEISRPEVSGR